MATKPSPELVELSRRRVLQIFGIGAAGAALVGTGAACSPSEKAKGKGEFHGAWPYEAQPKGHFNLVNPLPDAILGNYGIYMDLLVPPPAMYLWKERKYVGLLAEDGSWGFDEAAKTYKLKLKSGLKWSDGKAVTAKDLVTSRWLAYIMRDILWDYLDKVEATDELTCTAHMKELSTVVERYMLRYPIYSDAVYGEYAKRAQDIVAAGKDMDSPEGKKLNDDFQKFRPKKVVVSGPYNFDYTSITNSQLTLVKNKTGYGADKAAFEKIVLFNGEVPDVTPVVAAKNVDYATHGFPVASEKAFQKKGYRILRPPTYAGSALYLNLDKHPEFKDKRARQALAYAIDRKTNGTVTLGKSGVGVKYMTGMSDNLVPVWVTDTSKLNAYDLDKAKAESLLKAAGWKKSGGKWTTPQGKPAAYEISFPAEFADYSASGQNVADQLNEFGFKLTPRGVTHVEHPIDVDKGAFDMAIQTWGASTAPHPHFAFKQALFTHNIPVASNNGGRGIGFPLTQKTDAFGTIDLKKVVLDSAAGLDEEKQKANVTRAAIAFNELLPILPLFERYGNNPALSGVRVASWPPDSDPILQNAPYADNFAVMMLFDGRLKPA
ncbi:ABC transporter substrate-binding protein [Actinocatenispora rupis]|uniref:Peptide ABC transporter substrate-binding protein n=1 Tax=Actinocatenispora rupis TaxID=519421 RepID=A0A8J3JAT3_9ACTN|nr:ABC transporter substrate-binding protein [Actinocatenispora rupis]GID15025.1 peptide ABC transporter substrate-binding protein [Actinocatenispora rupis]